VIFTGAAPLIAFATFDRRFFRDVTTVTFPTPNLGRASEMPTGLTFRADAAHRGAERQPE
jgi:hypothetical protein